MQGKRGNKSVYKSQQMKETQLGVLEIPSVSLIYCTTLQMYANKTTHTIELLTQTKTATHHHNLLSMSPVWDQTLSRLYQVSLDLTELNRISARDVFSAQKEGGKCVYKFLQMKETQLRVLEIPSVSLIYCTMQRTYTNKATHMIKLPTQTKKLLRVIMTHTLRHPTSHYVISDITMPQPPVWPYSYVPVNHMRSRQYGWCQSTSHYQCC